MKKIFLINFFITLACFANDEIDKTQEISEILAKNSYEPNYFGMILGLFLVVALIYLTGFLYQKLIKTNIVSDEVYLNKAQIISTTSLGQGKNIHVIKIGNSACLIGATQNNITFLKDIELSELKKEGKANDKNS